MSWKIYLVKEIKKWGHSKEFNFSLNCLWDSKRASLRSLSPSFLLANSEVATPIFLVSSSLNWLTYLKSWTFCSWVSRIVLSIRLKFLPNFSSSSSLWINASAYESPFSSRDMATTHFRIGSPTSFPKSIVSVIKMTRMLEKVRIIAQSLFCWDSFELHPTYWPLGLHQSFFLQNVKGQWPLTNFYSLPHGGRVDTCPS